MKLQKIGKRLVFVQTGELQLFNTSLESVLKKLSLACRADLVFQLVSLKPLVSEHVVLAALEQAFFALDSGSSFSKKPELELLVRLSGKRQVSDALQLFGLQEKPKQFAVLVAVGADSTIQKNAVELGSEIGFRFRTGLFKSNFLKNKKFILDAFGILPSDWAVFQSFPEQKAVESLVLEKMALVELES